MSLEIKLTNEDVEKYDGLFAQMHPDSMSEKMNISYNEEKDGGFKGLIQKEYVDMVKEIGWSWIITTPISAIFSGGLYVVAKMFM